jgi:hypothetical protein
MTQDPTFTASTTNFLLNTANAANVGADNFILQITGFSENGVPISVPGLGTSFGLYVEGTVAVQGNPSVYGPGTIALILDPTNNDGTPSATWDPVTQSGSIGFSNLANTSDDITLATGSFTSGSFGTQSNGQPGANFGQTLNLNPAIFGPDAPTNLNIQELLFNTATSRVSGTTNDGGSYVTANDGYGTVSVSQASVTGGSSPTFYTGNNASRSLAELGTLAPSGGSGGLDIRALADEIMTDLGATLPASFLPGGRSGPWDRASSNGGSGVLHNLGSGGGCLSGLFSNDSHSMSH